MANRLSELIQIRGSDALSLNARWPITVLWHGCRCNRDVTLRGEHVRAFVRGSGLLFIYFVVGMRSPIRYGTRDCRVRIAIGHGFTNAARHFWTRFRAQDNSVYSFWRKLK